MANTDQFQAYIRPKSDGTALAVASKNLMISQSSEGFMSFRADYETSIDQRLYLYVIHNQIG